MLDFVPQAHADTYTMTGTAQAAAGTKDIADSGIPAMGAAITVIVPLIIFGLFKALVMKKV